MNQPNRKEKAPCSTAPMNGPMQVIANDAFTAF